jgi:hypothetical protein
MDISGVVLSRRRLVFTNSRMCFQYAKHSWLEGLRPNVGLRCSAMEDVSCNFSNGFDWIDLRVRKKLAIFLRSGIGTFSVAIYDRLSEYYNRQLPRNNDIPSTFKDAFNQFSDVRRTHGSFSHFWAYPLRQQLRCTLIRVLFSLCLSHQVYYGQFIIKNVRHLLINAIEYFSYDLRPHTKLKQQRKINAGLTPKNHFGGLNERTISVL